MSAEDRVEWTGNIQVHHPAKPATQPAAVEHYLIETTHIAAAARTYECSGCPWTVDVYPTEDAEALLARAFDQHLAAARTPARRLYVVPDPDPHPILTAKIAALRITNPALYTAITERDPVTGRTPEEPPPAT